MAGTGNLPTTKYNVNITIDSVANILWTVSQHALPLATTTNKTAGQTTSSETQPRTKKKGKKGGCFNCCCSGGVARAGLGWSKLCLSVADVK